MNQFGKGLLYLHIRRCYILIKKIAHIVFAALILVSSTGFTISVHYCHDQLIDLGLFSPAHSCCEKPDHGSCPAGDALSKMNHCKDESIVVESTDDYEAFAPNFNLENISSIDLLLSVSILFNIQGSDVAIVTEAPWHKEPPPYRAVVLSQIQSYLI
jgi:hypothetical protein